MTIIIFANGEKTDKRVVDKVLSDIEDNKLIIACDGGASLCKQLDITPDYVVGDFDSYGLNEIPKHKILMENQNLTDLQKTLKFIEKFNPEKVTIFSAFGKRFDHTIANLLIFYHQLAQAIKLEVYDNFGKFFLIRKGKTKINEKIGTTISFFALSKIEDLKLSGFMYENIRYQTDDYFIGISNVVNSDEAYVSLSKGVLICYIPFEKALK